MTAIDRRRSHDLGQRARRVIPGGVNSPVRSFAAVGGEPVFMAGGAGCRLRTVDGDELIDLCGSWGPLILGHAHPVVIEAVTAAVAEGTSFGANTADEVVLAETIVAAVPVIEQLRLVNSGTEAVMTALRLARGITGRDKILKFAGGYHGHADHLLVEAGSGVRTHGHASSAGVSAAVVRETLVVPYHDLAAVDEMVATHGDDLAAIIVEPVAGNMGLVAAETEYLRGLRAACDRCGALLIFDEVISGFRFAATTWGTLVGVDADLVCLGKIIGGGMPIGAVGGRRAHMAHLAPEGAVYQAGTLSGNPVAVAAGRATLDELLAHPPYQDINAVCSTIVDGLRAAAARHGVPLQCPRLGGAFTPFFCAAPVRDLDGASASDRQAYAAFFQAMLAHGVYLPPAQFERAFIGAAHDQRAAAAICSAADAALEAVAARV